MLPRLIWVTPDGVAAEEIEQLSLSGVNTVQLRDKSRSKEEIRQLAHQLIPLIEEAGLLLLINTYADIALEVGAKGVHLPEICPHPREELLTGRSLHRIDPDLARGCDYLFFGPIFATPSKAGYGPPQGLDRLRQLCEAVPIPVYAIGGVDCTNLQSCLDQGAAGVAVQRGIYEFI